MSSVIWLFVWIEIVLRITYLLTPRCRVLLEQLTGLQLVKKFPTFHGTRRFITALTSVRNLSLSWASPIQSIFPHPTSWRSILILSTHLRLGLLSGLLPSGFPSKTLYTSLSSPIRGRRGITVLILNLAARWGGWSTPCPGRVTPALPPRGKSLGQCGRCGEEEKPRINLQSIC